MIFFDWVLSFFIEKQNNWDIHEIKHEVLPIGELEASSSLSAYGNRKKELQEKNVKNVS